jgi:NAD(P)-dependent dehydrogenase (short-subunit alcohol dehydrogenase family)
VCEFSYAQSKAAEKQLTQLMSAALQPFHIRVNSICPGLFPSGLTLNGQGELWTPMKEATKIIPKG